MVGNTRTRSDIKREAIIQAATQAFQTRAPLSAIDRHRSSLMAAKMCIGVTLLSKCTPGLTALWMTVTWWL